MRDVSSSKPLGAELEQRCADLTQIQQDFGRQRFRNCLDSRRASDIPQAIVWLHIKVILKAYKKRVRNTSSMFYTG